MFNYKITDEDIDMNTMSENKLNERTASRGIVVNDGKIAIFCKTVKNEFELPGGGVDEGESLERAFKREVLEETGCEIDIIKKMGVIKEYRTHDNFKQTSHVFLGCVINNTMNLDLTEKERNEGGSLIWCNAEEGLNLIRDAYPNLKSSTYESIYHTKFISKRVK